MVGKLEYPESLIKVYTAFRDEVYNPESVLYSSCGFDASPSRIFRNVTFVDLEKGNEGCVAALREAGLKAISADVRSYKPTEKHDLLLLQNPSAPPEWATPHLISGGWVIANNYHGTSSKLNKILDFSLWGAIDSPRNSGRASITRDLTGFFQPVKDAEEYKRLRPEGYEFDFGVIDSFVSQGIIDCPKDASLDAKLAAYLESLNMSMPSKRVADYYIFRKK